MIIIPWNSDRFVIREYLDTGAVYIYDKIDKGGYINQTETSLLCECRQSALSNIIKKTPKELERKLGKSLSNIMVENLNGGKAYACFDHEQFWNVLGYYSMYAAGHKERDNAKELLMRIGKAGSLAFIMHRAGVALQPVLDQRVDITELNGIQLYLSRESGVADRNAFTDALLIEYRSNPDQWIAKEKLTLEQYFECWTNFTYAMLFATNADGLRALPFCLKNHTVLIGRNHLDQTEFMEALSFTERYVAEMYDKDRCNNLKGLITTGATKAHRLHPTLPKGKGYLDMVEELPQLTPYKEPFKLLSGEGYSTLGFIGLDDINF